MTGVVLAGGKSTRLGVNKALVRIRGRTLLERALDRVAQVADDLIVVVAAEDWVTPQLGSRAVRVVADLYPGGGSLGGIYTGLRATSSAHSLVVACDMPFLSVPLLRYLAEAAPGFDIVIPRQGEALEPLHAVYSQGCLGPMERLLEQGHLKIIDFFGQMRVRYVTEVETAPLDPHSVSFFNINTLDDLAKAEEVAKQLGE